MWHPLQESTELPGQVHMVQNFAGDRRHSTAVSSTVKTHKNSSFRSHHIQLFQLKLSDQCFKLKRQDYDVIGANVFHTKLN